METIQAITGRRSVRKYKEETVSRELMTEIIDITRFAPSWTNSQTPRWTLVDDLETIKRFSNESVKDFIYNTDTLKTAPGVAILSFVQGKSGIVTKYGLEGDNSSKWEVFDAGIAAQTFCLTAHAKGVATCILGVIDEESIGEIIDLPEDEAVAAIIVYGLAAEEPKAPRRRDVSQLLRWG